MLSISICLVTIELMRLLKFNPSIIALAATFRRCFVELTYIGLMFVVVFMSCVQLFFLLYSDSIAVFSTFTKSIEIWLRVVSGITDLSFIRYSNGIVLIVLAFFVNFILLTLFLSVLAERIHSTKVLLSHESEDNDIIGFIFNIINKRLKNIKKRFSSRDSNEKVETITPDMYVERKEPVIELPLIISETLKKFYEVSYFHNHFFFNTYSLN